MAEAIGRSAIAEKLGGPDMGSSDQEQWLADRGWKVCSAGITEDYEPVGSPASLHGINAMRAQLGLDLSSHRSSMLTKTRIEEAHVIYTVSPSHREWICNQVMPINSRI